MNYPPSPPSPEDTLAYNKYIENQKCHYLNIYDFYKRQRIYPFSKSEKIVIVSFAPVIEASSNQTTPKSANHVISK